jgi:sugar lactone lactonase YvrE
MKRPAIQPVVWQPAPPAPRPGRRALPPLRILEVPGKGPEDVVVDAEGRVLTGLADGRILRLTPDGKHIQTVANTGGRPLGIELLQDGALLVCDAHRGLLRVEPKSGEVQLLLDRIAGVPMRFCNNAAVARDGTVYFSDSSRRFSIEHWRADLMEHSGTGRLLRRSPDGRVDVLIDGLQFANGVALSADEAFVTVAETGGYRLMRYWLRGPRAGSRDVFIDRLGGFPDNIALGSDGLIWITQASPRDPRLDRLHSLPPVLRKLAWSLPERLLSGRRTFWVLAVDDQGRVVHDLEGEHPNFHIATGVREHRGTVYLGTLEDRAIAAFSLR